MAAQVHADDVVPLAVGHVDDRAVPQNAGVVDQHVQRSELLDRELDQPVRARGGGDVIATRDRLAACGSDLRHDLLSRSLVTARAVGPAAEVVHHDLGPLGGEQQGVLATQAATGPGDDGNPVVKCAHSGSLRRRL